MLFFPLIHTSKQSVNHFGPDWNTKTTTGCVVIKLFTDIFTVIFMCFKEKDWKQSPYKSFSSTFFTSHQVFHTGFLYILLILVPKLNWKFVTLVLSSIHQPMAPLFMATRVEKLCMLCVLSATHWMDFMELNLWHISLLSLLIKSNPAQFIQPSDALILNTGITIIKNKKRKCDPQLLSKQPGRC